VDARATSERIHTDARVVSEDRAIYVRAVVECLLAGVCLKRRPIFEAKREAVDPGNGFQSDPAGGSRGTELTEFPGISGSEIEVK
jgi:hypothetical protein